MYRLTVVLLTLVLATPAARAQAEAPADRRIDNLVALARLYNAVRFFHPSDAVAAMEWGGFMMHASTRVAHARDGVELRDRLAAVFEPIAPTLMLATGSTPADTRSDPAPDAVHVHWRHRGIQYGERSNVYRSPRVPTDDPDTPAEASVAPGETAIIDLGRGVHARVPLTLATDDDGRTVPAADPDRLAELLTDITLVGADRANGDDLYARVASIAMIWAAMDSFFPYFDVVEVDWDAELRESLRRALMPQNGDTFALVVSRMVEQLEDGHGIIGYRFQQWPHQPTARFERLRDGEIAVTRTWGESRLRVGDVVLSLDGRPAETELAGWKMLTSGSEHLQEHRALNRFGSGPPNSLATIVVDRDGTERTLEEPRSEIGNMFFREQAFDHPMFEEVESGVWYVNLSKVDAAGFAAHEARLAEADGIILDYRWGGSAAGDFDAREFVLRLLDGPSPSPQWQFPIVTRPGRERRTWQASGWSLGPAPVRFEARVAVLTAPPIVSYGETLMSFFDEYDLAIRVGSPTAGCNGNANTLTDLPSGVFVTFTGMKVEKHDGSTLYGVGYEPHIPVMPSLDGIRAGEDEVRDAAIEALAG